MTMTETRGTESGVTWKEAVEEARANAGKLPEVLRAHVQAAIELAEEKLPGEPTPVQIDTAIWAMQDSLPWAIEEILEGMTPKDRRTAECIQVLAAEVLDLRAKVATLEGARS